MGNVVAQYRSPEHEESSVNKEKDLSALHEEPAIEGPETSVNSDLLST